MVKQVTSARFNQVTSHFNVMMSKIQQQHFEAEQGIGPRVQPKFSQFADETNNFHLSFNVDLILRVNKKVKRPLRVLSRNYWSRTIGVPSFERGI